MSDRCYRAHLTDCRGWNCQYASCHKVKWFHRAALTKAQREHGMKKTLPVNCLFTFARRPSEFKWKQSQTCSDQYVPPAIGITQSKCFFGSLGTWRTPLHINGCLRKSPVSNWETRKPSESFIGQQRLFENLQNCSDLNAKSPETASKFKYWNTSP